MRMRANETSRTAPYMTSVTKVIDVEKIAIAVRSVVTRGTFRLEIQLDTFFSPMEAVTNGSDNGPMCRRAHLIRTY